MGFFTKSPHFLHVIFSVELQVAVLDPAETAADRVDGRRKDRGQHDGDEDEAQPVKARGDRKSTRLNSSHYQQSRMPSSA